MDRLKIGSMGDPLERSTEPLGFMNFFKTIATFYEYVAIYLLVDTKIRCRRIRRGSIPRGSRGNIGFPKNRPQCDF